MSDLRIPRKPPYNTHEINSDVDHSGKANEASKTDIAEKTTAEVAAKKTTRAGTKTTGAAKASTSEVATDTENTGAFGLVKKSRPDLSGEDLAKAALTYLRSHGETMSVMQLKETASVANENYADDEDFNMKINKLVQHFLEQSTNQANMGAKLDDKG